MDPGGKQRSPAGREAGFNAIIVSMLILVAGLVAASMFLDPLQTSVSARTANTLDKLHMVETRLTGFMIANGRLPCPADGQYPENKGTAQIAAEICAQGFSPRFARERARLLSEPDFQPLA
jgi:hypothetical protein